MTASALFAAVSAYAQVPGAPGSAWYETLRGATAAPGVVRLSASDVIKNFYNGDADKKYSIIVRMPLTSGETAVDLTQYLSAVNGEWNFALINCVLSNIRG